jgi:DNA-binding transcriptional MerR regulator
VLRCLRDTGMPIARMRRYAELAREGEPTLAERLRLLTDHDLTDHDGQVSERIAVLQAQRQHLQEKIGWYRSQLSANGGS